MAKEFRRGSKIDGFMNFSPPPPPELVKLMISMVATAQWDQSARIVWTRGTREQFRDRDVHTDINRAYFHAPSIKEKCPEMWSKSMDGSECRCTAFVTQPQTGMRYAKVLREHSCVFMPVLLTNERNQDYCPWR